MLFLCFFYNKVFQSFLNIMTKKKKKKKFSGKTKFIFRFVGLPAWYFFKIEIKISHTQKKEQNLYLKLKFDLCSFRKNRRNCVF